MSKVKNCRPQLLVAAEVFLCRTLYSIPAISSVSKSTSAAHKISLNGFKKSSDKDYQFVID